MQSSVKKVVFGSSVFILTLIIAVGGYLSAGWSLLEALYMVIITIYGVGYGEVRAVDDPGLRIFTMGFIVVGCTSAVFAMGGLVQMIAEGEINKALGARRMTEGIKRLNDHAIICGFGRVGQILATELKNLDVPFVVIDQDRERLLEAENLSYLVYFGDATEESTLSAVGIDSARVLATVLPNDALNVFITLSARELNSTIEIIARGESPSTKRKLLRSGANQVVMPAAVGASKIAQLIARPSTSTLLRNNDFESRLNDDLDQLGINLQETKISKGSHLIGRTILELEKKTERGIVVVAIYRTDGTMLSQPEKSTSIEEGDTIAFLGHKETLLAIKSLNKTQSVIYRGARIDP